MRNENAPEKMGRYELLVKLAVGGMAEIYLARQTGIKGFARLAVVKRILPHLASQKRFVEMFLDEARIAAQLNHPNIVHIYDLGQTGNDYFIAMEYLEGESLGFLAQTARRADYPLPAELAAVLVREVGEGLEHAHQFLDELGNPLRIVHRDISPHNIIVLFSGRVKLVDFGIAKAASQAHHTASGTLKGKPSYMSPEQLYNKPVDGRSDIFSLGVIFWELLCSKRLFKRDSDAATIQAVLNEPVPRVRDIRSDVAQELEAIALRALEKKPDDRYQSAGEMATDIDAYLKRSGAGTRELAAFINHVLAERVYNKKRILKKVRSGRIGDAAMGELKPGSDKSLASPSRQGKETESDIQVEIPTRVADTAQQPEEVEVTDQPTGIRDFDPPETERARRLGAQSGKGPQRERATMIASLALPAALLVVLGTLWLTLEERPAQPIAPPAAENHPASAVAGARSPAVSSGPQVDPVRISGTEIAPKSKRPSAAEARPKPEAHKPPAEKPAPKSAPKRRAVKRRAVKELRPGSKPKPDTIPRRRFNPSRIPKPVGETTEPKAGVLNLNTVPWSEIFRGKKRLGMTPLLGKELAPGKYTLTAVNRGKGIEKNIRVTIKSGQKTDVFIELNE